MKWFEAKVLIRQIPGIPTVLGKAALIGNSLRLNTTEEKKQNLNFSCLINRTTKEGVVSREVQFDKMHLTLPNLDVA